MRLGPCGPYSLLVYKDHKDTTEPVVCVCVCVCVCVTVCVCARVTTTPLLVYKLNTEPIGSKAKGILSIQQSCAQRSSGKHAKPRSDVLHALALHSGLRCHADCTPSAGQATVSEDGVKSVGAHAARAAHCLFYLFSPYSCSRQLPSS